MFRNDQGANAYEHNQGGLEYAAFVRCQNRFSECIFMLASLGHEDGIIVSLSENECCKYYVDYVELDAQQGHDSENPYPAHCHREEGYQSQFEASEGEPKENEDYKRAGPADIVEVV